jgi:hypothetical protein
MPTDDFARALITSLTSRVDTTVAAIQKQLAGQANSLLTLRNDVDAIKPPPPDPVPYPEPTAAGLKTIRLSATATDADVQAALDQAVLDRESTNVEVRAYPRTFGGNIRIKANPKAKGMLTIRPDTADGNLAPTSIPWVTPDALPYMVRFASGNNGNDLSCEDAVGNVRLFGCAFTANTSPSSDLVYIGRGDMTSLAQMPWRWEFDSCLFMGDPVKGQHRGLQMNVAYGTVKRSHFHDFMELRRDSQAFFASAGPGPYLIEDTFMAATGENLLFGGADPAILGLVPSDITIQRCEFYKDPAWKTTFKDSVKNSLELKNAQRVKILFCRFNQNWLDAQPGHMIVLNVRNQDGRAPWSTVSDVEIGYCVALDNQNGHVFNLLGLDDHLIDGAMAPSVQGKNIRIHDVLMVNCAGAIQTNRGFQPTIVQHITTAATRDKFLQFAGPAPTQPAGSFTIESSVLRAGQYGIAGEGTTVGTPSWAANAPGGVFRKNVIENPFYYDGTGQKVPYRLSFPNEADNAFLSFPGMDQRLDVTKAYTGTEVGVDGDKAGANVTKIAAGMPWAKW